MAEPNVRFKRDDGSHYPALQQVPFGDVVKPFIEKTKTENEDVLLSCAIDGMYLNSELFGHQRGSSNIGYKKVRRNTLILSAQNLHLGNANVNQRFDHGIISPAYNTYDIVGCNPDYMAQWIKREATRKFFYNATTTGASQCRRNVDWNALYEQLFYVPCEEEQQKIANFLSSVDEVISTSEAEVANLETQKKAVMKKIFSREVRFRRGDGSDFPEWEEKQIINIAPLQRGFDLPASELQEGSFPVVYSNGIGAYHSAYKCEGDAVITGRSGTTGSFTYLKNCKYWPHNTSLWVTDFCGNNSLFIYYWYQSINISRFSTGTGVPTLNRNNIHEALSSIPKSIEEQRLIADFLSSFDEAITAAKKELELWKELKKGLLQQMFV